MISVLTMLCMLWVFASLYLRVISGARIFTIISIVFALITIILADFNLLLSVGG